LETSKLIISISIDLKQYELDLYYIQLI